MQKNLHDLPITVLSVHNLFTLLEIIQPAIKRMNLMGMVK